MAINPWLEEKLSKLNSPKTISIIVESEPSEMPRVLSELQRRGISADPRVVRWNRFVTISVPPGQVSAVAALPGVRYTHYNMPRWITSSIERIDPLIGKYRLSSVEIPRFPLLDAVLGAPLAPLLALDNLLGLTARVKDPRVEIITTETTAKLLGVPDKRKCRGIVAVLDTGLSLHPVFHPSKKLVRLSTTGEPPDDGLGHGMWVASCAWGDTLSTRFGNIRGMSDPELDDSKVISVKVLSNFGFGSTDSVLAGMQLAYDMGARVINMSLGGPLQGGVDLDPECQIIQETSDEVIWCVAAGNDGPEPWTIGSPGAAPKALTVGAWSPLYDGLALFSSRGPQATWYRDNPEAYERDQAKYGESFGKPDLCCYGGGPVEEGQKMDLIHSAATGWTDPMWDLTIDGLTPMRGTSMATPHVAGLVTLARSMGLINSAQDVKMKLARSRRKSPEMGYGLLKWSDLEES